MAKETVIIQNQERPLSNSPTKLFGVILTIILVGINLRPFLAGPGPVIDNIMASTGMSYSAVSLLTLLPMLLMGIGAFAVPTLSSRYGVRKGLISAMMILLLGSLLRYFVDTGVELLLSALLCGMGVAYIQAVFPGLIKAQFPTKVAVMTGLYSAMLMIGGALGAQLTPLLAELTGRWQTALAWLALPALFALIALILTAKNQISQTPQNIVSQLLRKPRAWLLIVGFGFINAGYASVVTWLAPFYQSLGYSQLASGTLVAFITLFQAAAALLIPILASHNIDRRFWLIVTLLMQMAGFIGLVVYPLPFSYLWCALLGIGLGGCFSLTIITSLDHLPHPASAGALAALMQGGGFIIASLGPLLSAGLLDLTGSFYTGWGLQSLMVILTLCLFIRLDPKKYHQVISLK